MLLRRLLTPPPDTAPRTVRPQDVGGEIAFDSLHASGHLLTLAPGIGVLPGLVTTPTDRLLAIGPRIPPRTVVGRLSAEWVHTGHGAPTPLTVLYSPRAHRPPLSAGIQTHQATLAPDDVAGVGSLRITSPLRTALDLTRHVARSESLPALERLYATGLLDLEELRTRVHEQPHGPLTSESADIVATLSARVSPCGPRAIR
ncbi:hypothetical protein ACTVCO_09410 [Sanguibacter sp. A247]|uniref:hypothetical protein n=1 Tax=unclassified Sanguibacter TaxID=2645534 RepID=UPI003FD78F0E